jgi:orotate phosphoribosyltransferase
MERYKRDFIELMVEAEVLSFGDFTTKSGRKTPYFVNTGRFRTGSHLRRLAGHYADAIFGSFGRDFDVLFGPAYKGIPLAAATAMACAERGRDAAFCFNRKEAKDHGEGGALVGHSPADGDRVVIIEDVTTAGTSIRETVPILRAAANVQLVGLVVAVDRQERATGSQSALDEVAHAFSMKTTSIVTVTEIFEYLATDQRPGGALIAPDDRARFERYREQYGTQ